MALCDWVVYDSIQAMNINGTKAGTLFAIATKL